MARIVLMVAAGNDVQKGSEGAGAAEEQIALGGTEIGWPF
jgi:hypothetical protein